MNQPHPSPPPVALLRIPAAAAAVWLALPARQSHASIFQGEALDTVADVLSWLVLVIAPIAVIAIFLLIHILPEKIAEKKNHPQAKAIACLCLLSLFFGGILWPLAWIWAYTKPVLHKLAYGTDGTEKSAAEAQNAEAEALRAKVARLEKRLAGVAASLSTDSLKGEA